VQRAVSGEWHPTWNQQETWEFLEGVIAAYQTRGARSLVVFWDNGPWHVAASVRQKVRAQNRLAKQEGVSTSYSSSCRSRHPG
jgi:hypothetical protein